MRRDNTRVPTRTGTVALAFLFVLSFSLGACPGPERGRTRWSAGDVTLRLARQRDWNLTSDSMDVQVAGRGRKAGHVRALAARGEPPSGPRDLAVGLEVDGTVHAARRISVGAAKRGGRPVLRIEGRVRVRERVWDLATELHVVPESAAVKARTRVTLREGAAGGTVRVADVIDWGGTDLFAPGPGHLPEEGRLSVPWVAGLGDRSASAIVAREGDLDLGLQPDPDGLGGLVAAGDLDHAVYERFLVLAPPDSSAVAALAWSLRGEPHHLVRGRVRGPLQGVEVVVLRAEGGVEAFATPGPDGRFVATVRPGTYTLRADGSTGRAEQAVEAPATEEAALSLPAGGTLRISVSDDAGAPLPARALVRGISPTPDPVLGPRHRADGALQSVCLTEGPVELPLPVGRYRIGATHGVEWSIDDREVDLPVREIVTVALVLHHEFETPGLVPGDFHLHAAPSSDSLVSLEDRVRSLLCEGVEFAVPTDHNVITDYAPATAELGFHDRLATMSGVEITTPKQFGHFNAYPVDTANGPMPFPFEDTTPAAIFDSVHRQYPDAVLQVNHPRSGPRQYFGKMRLDARSGRARNPAYRADFDAIEVWNGKHMNRPQLVETNVTEWMSLLAAGLRYTAMGNSDSHRIQPEWVGYPRSYVQVPDDEPARIRPSDVAASIKAGRVVVTNGPMVELTVEGEGPGATVRARGGEVSVRVRAHAARWIETTRVEIWVGGELRETFPVEDPTAPGLRGEWSVRIPVRPPTFVVAMVRGERVASALHLRRAGPPLGFTNPVFVR